MKRQTKDDLIYGVHPVTEAIRSGSEIDLILTQRRSNPGLQELMSLARQEGIPVRSVPREKLDRTVRKEHQGVIAFLNKVPHADLSEIITAAYEKGETPLVIICDGITDVRNIGAMARSAECMGAHALVVPGTRSARLGSDAIKSSAGALLKLPVARVDKLKEAIECCRGQGLTLVGLSEKGQDTIEQCDLCRPLAVVMGDEHDGLSPTMLSNVDDLLQIPMHGKIGSLNVSVATGITLDEVVRQRGR